MGNLFLRGDTSWSQRMCRKSLLGKVGDDVEQQEYLELSGMLQDTAFSG